jgi:hypothetical protein
MNEENKGGDPEDGGVDLEKQIRQLKAEVSGLDKKNAKLQAENEELKSKGFSGDPAQDDQRAAAADLLGRLREREAWLKVKEHAIERAEKDSIPYSLALKLAGDDIEATDVNLDELVKMADGVFDAALSGANWREVRASGDPNTKDRKGAGRVPSQQLSALKDQKGRGFDVGKLSAAEIGRIPKGVREAMIKNAGLKEGA